MRKQIVPWMLASLFVATSGFGQDELAARDKMGKNGCEPAKCEQKCEKVCPPVCPVKLIPAYNQAAMMKTDCSWDLYLDLSFIYWQVMEDSLAVGITNSSSTTPGSLPMTGNVVDIDFEYLPGFQLELGYKTNYDDWDICAKYTYVHGSSNGTATAPAGGQVESLWVHPSTIRAAGSTYFTNIAGTFESKLDFMDVNLGRSYYSGKRLTCRPFFGVRGAWIRQSYATNSISGTSGTGTNSNTFDQTSSWGLGLETGMMGNWTFDQGFRLYGNAMADVVYSLYNVHAKQTGVTAATAGTQELNVSDSGVGAVRAHTDLEFGLGWGTYIDCQNWYFDLSAGYGFQVFWDQQMFYNWVDDQSVGKATFANGNLLVHGLTIQAKLDF
jgi:hypothetical protein